MADLKAYWQAHKPTRRRLIQVYAALLYNANLKGFLQGSIYTGPLKNACVPGLNCYSCPGAVGACPLGALQNALASSGSRAPTYILGILLLFGLTLGRTICGWLCPMGLLQELLYKLPTPKAPKNHFTQLLSWLKYVMLGIFVVALPLIYAVQRLPLPAFCKYICPAGTLEGAIALLAHPANTSMLSMLGMGFTIKFVLLTIILTGCVFVYRAFCRFLCPLGAIYSLFARVSMLGVTVNENACTHCGRCTAQCRMDVRHAGDRECIHCGECISACPEQAISWKGGKVLLHGHQLGAAAEHRSPAVPLQRSRIRSICAWACALTVLIGWYWLVDLSNPAAVPEAAAVSDTAWPDTNILEGFAVGERPAPFTVPLYGGGDWSLTAQYGKVTVINLWATWCSPCCKELPCFQQLHDSWPDDVALVAIHSSLVTDDVQAYLDAQPYTFSFALDPDGSVIASLGGSTMLPMTVVLDRTGTVVYNQVGSMTWELLQSIVEPLR